MFRIISLDGGGIRGVLTARLLERLEEARPGTLGRADLFAGVSTGAILALGLAAGLPPSTIRDLYEAKGREVFADSVWDDIKDLGQLRGAQYSNAPLKRELAQRFGDMTLGDLQRRVLVVAFDLDNESTDPAVPRTWKPKIFHNFPGDDSDAGERVVDVALRSSAAPSYFPVYQGYVDGGIATNNPSVCALAQAIDAATGGQQLADLAMLSLGTGLNQLYLTGTDSDWGLLQWARPLVDLIVDGSTGIADYQSQRLLGSRYFRLNPPLPEVTALDDVRKIPMLSRLGEQVDLQPAVRWLDRHYLGA